MDPEAVDYVSSTDECSFLIEAMEDGNVTMEDVIPWVARINSKIKGEQQRAEQKLFEAEHTPTAGHTHV